MLMRVGGKGSLSNRAKAGRENLTLAMCMVFGRAGSCNAQGSVCQSIVSLLKNEPPLASFGSLSLSCQGFGIACWPTSASFTQGSQSSGKTLINELTLALPL